MSTEQVKAGGAFVEVSLRDRLKQGARSIQSHMSTISSSISSFGSGLLAVGATATTAFGGIVAALAWPTKAAADLEQLKVSFEVMTGSAATAQTMLAEIQKFAAETPFDFPGLSKAAQTLLAYGLANEKIMPALRTLGDIAGGSQEKLERLAVAFGQTQTKGKLMAQEVNQMVENGFNPLQEISRTSGRSMEELFKAMENGEISADMVSAAFVSATREGGNFFGMMEKQSKTVLGRVGMLFDALKKAIRPVGEQLLKAVGTVTDSLLGIIGPVANFIERNKELSTVIAAIAVGGTLFGVVASAIGAALIGVSAAIAAVGAAVPSLVAIGGFLAPLLPAILPIIGAIAAIGTSIGTLVYFAYQAGIVTEVFSNIKATALELYKTVSQTFAGIASALADGNFSKAGEIAIAGIKLAFLQGTKAAYDGVLWLLSNAGRLLFSFAKSIGDTLFSIFKSIPKLLYSALMGGASLGHILREALTGGLSDSLKSSIDEAQKDLDALTAKSNKPKTGKTSDGKGGLLAGTPNLKSPAIDEEKLKEENANKKAIEDRIAALKEENTELRLGANAADLLKLAQQGASAEQIAAVKNLQAERDGLKARAKAEEDRKKKAEDAKKAAEDQRKDMAERGKKMAEEVRTPFQVLSDKMKEINQLAAGGFIDKTTAGLQRQAALDEFSKPARDAAMNGRNTIADINTQGALDIVLRTQRQFNQGGGIRRSPAEELQKEANAHLKAIADSVTRGGGVGSGVTINIRKIG